MSDEDRDDWGDTESLKYERMGVSLNMWEEPEKNIVVQITSSFAGEAEIVIPKAKRPAFADIFDLVGKTLRIWCERDDVSVPRVMPGVPEFVAG